MLKLSPSNKTKLDDLKPKACLRHGAQKCMQLYCSWNPDESWSNWSWITAARWAYGLFAVNSKMLTVEERWRRVCGSLVTN